MTIGGDEDHENLLAALEEASGEEEGQAHVIGDADIGNPSDLANFTDEPLPGAGEGIAAEFGNLDSLSLPEQDLFPEGQIAMPEGAGDGLLSAEDLLSGEDLLKNLGAMNDPGEYSASFTNDPLADVDSLLASEVLGDVDPFPSTFLSPGMEGQPTFTLQLLGVDAGMKARLRDLALAQELELTPSAWEKAVPILSQLTEYQAVLFQRGARALGASVKASLAFPQASISEDDLALGDLAGVPDPVEIHSEGAPSVKLPGSEKGVLLFSGDKIPDFILLETKGPVTAHRSIVRRLFLEAEAAEKLQKELERIPGQHSAAPSSKLAVLFRELFADLQAQALSLGCNAVLSIKLQTFSERAASDPAAEQLRLLVIGTAAVVEKSL